MKKGKFTGIIVGIVIVFAMLGMIIASSLALSVETEATPAILVENHSPVEPSENYGIGLMGKIAFVHDVYPGNSEIYVMNADGTNQIQLTDSPQNDYHPAWSPDGTKIAFCSPRDGDWEIYVMTSDGSNQTRLTNNPAVDANPSWSPDGTMIAFNSHRDGDWEIYVMTPDGSNQTRLTNNAADDDHPSWSPDGTKIAFLSDRDGNREIYVMNAGGGGEERVTYNSACDEEPSWSPDGNRIAFESDRDGNYEIYAMNADGSGQTRLTTNPAWDYGPTWSPDSTKIAFTSLRDSNREIYAMNADGSGQTRLTENAVSDFSPAWSPVSNGIPPIVSNTSPEDGATAVTVDTTVTATFSEPMDGSTITTESFTLAGSAISGTVTYDPDTYTATFTPDANLAYEHYYTATLSTAITDLAGNPLAEPYTWSFTTELSQNHSPVASSLSLTGQPQVMYPDAEYTVTAKYFDPDGREDLKYCYLQLKHPDKPLTMMWDQAIDDFWVYAGEEGENYLTVTGTSSPITEGDLEGYELTWRFTINDQWPEAENTIDFGVYAWDDADLTSDWDYDDTNASFLVPPPGILLIPSEEDTWPWKPAQVGDLIRRHIEVSHILALNVDDPIDQEDPLEERLGSITEQGGIAILAHPEPIWTPSYIIESHGYAAIEVYNAVVEKDSQKGGVHSRVSGWYDSAWDYILEERVPSGGVVWGIASDDAHEKEDYGKTWVMVRATALDKEKILAGIEDGNFYAVKGPSEDPQVITDMSVAQDNRTITVTLSREMGAVVSTGRTGDQKYVYLPVAATHEYTVDGTERWVRFHFLMADDLDGCRAWTQPLLVSADGVTMNPYEEGEGNWYKGQLHCHTTGSDAKWEEGADWIPTPDNVVQLYTEKGYDFLAITDHNRITLPGHLTMTTQLELTGNVIWRTVSVKVVDWENVPVNGIKVSGRWEWDGQTQQEEPQLTNDDGEVKFRLRLLVLPGQTYTLGFVLEEVTRPAWQWVGGDTSKVVTVSWGPGRR